MTPEIAAPEPDLSSKADKKTIDFGAFLKKGKITNAKNDIFSSAKAPLQPWCSHYNTIYGPQLQKTIVLRTQPQQRGTLMQPLPPLRSAETELQNTKAQRQQQQAESHQQTSITTHAKIEKDSTQRKHALARKKQCFFHATPNIQISSVMLQFQCNLATATCNTQ